MLRRLAVSAVLMASLSKAALVRIEVKERSDAFTGYERVIGRAFFAVDPSLPANRIIVDIDKAPRNAEGQVEFSSDIYILKPKDPRAGNGSVLFEVSNRCGKGMLGIFNRAGGSTDPHNERDFGDGFLFEQGYAGMARLAIRRAGATQSHAPLRAGCQGGEGPGASGDHCGQQGAEPFRGGPQSPALPGAQSRRRRAEAYGSRPCGRRAPDRAARPLAR